MKKEKITSPRSELRVMANPQTTHAIARTAPKAEKIEESILGALMLEKDALSTVMDLIKPDNFYKEAHQTIYNAIITLFNQSASVDVHTVTEQLRKEGKLTHVGGPAYIAYLTNTVSAATNIEFHARIIIEYAIRRTLIKTANQIYTNAYDNTIDVFNLLDQAEQALFEIGEAHFQKTYSGMNHLIATAFKNLEEKQKQGFIGLPSGFTALDRITGGWQKAELTILAARPGMGKTALGLNIARNAAIKYKQPVAIFSLEMSSAQLANRLIAAEAELESEKIKNGNLSAHEWEQLATKTQRLKNAPIFVDDTPGLSIFELRAKCRRLKAKHNIQLIFVDYLQLMTGHASRHGAGNREQEIASISRALKSIAKELDIPVIAASQLSRAVETRGGNKKPQLSDLRESGSIEQDADLVLFPYRAEYYGLDEDEERNSTKGSAEIIVAKHRNGPTGSCLLEFIAQYTKFANKTTFNNAFLEADGMMHYEMGSGTIAQHNARET